MRIIHGVRQLPSAIAGSCLTIGNFDGVHLGHQALLANVVARARHTKQPAIVMTFDPHPVKVLHPDRGMNRIFDFDDQRERFETLGLDILVVEPFSREFSQVPADRFIKDWVFKPFNPSSVVVGYDFSFGANRDGSIDFMKAQATELGFDLEVVPPVKVDGVLVSSTRIRKAVEAGEVKLASALLGRHFYLRGLVEKGAGRGRTIGIPTANLRTTAETLPMRGVYAAYATVRGVRHKSVVNIGLNPTFNENANQALSVEAHLIDFKLADIYGEEVRLDFKDRLRDESKFPNVEALVKQIKQDIEIGKAMLDGE
ncbi:MAG: bifunctional riboflavin kinase/FAD synthetase [Bdellovibrionota bacterium]